MPINFKQLFKLLSAYGTHNLVPEPPATIKAYMENGINYISLAVFS